MSWRRGTRPLGRSGTVLAWLGAAASLTFAGLRAFGIDHQYLLATIISFTPYAALLAVVAVVFAAVLRRWWATGIALLAVAVLGVLVVPRAVGGGPHPQGPRLRILTVNLRHGQASPSRIVELVRRERVDVLAVEEFSQGAKMALKRAGLARRLPFTDPRPLSGLLDTGLYARFPLKRIISVRGTSRSTAVEAHVIVPGTGDVVVRAVHIHALSPSLSWLWRRMMGDLPPTRDRALRIIAGDFNATLDHSPFRAVLGRGYADAADRVGRGLDPTWPASRRFGLTIDHVLVDRRIGVDRVRVIAVEGTDHRAVLAEVTLPSHL